MMHDQQIQSEFAKPLKRFAIWFFAISPRLKSWAKGNNTTYLNRFSGLPALALAALLLCTSFVDARAGEENYRAKNISWKLIKDEIVITYDLEGAFTETYNVSVRMLRERDKTFVVEPKTISGDVGDDKVVGTRKTIRWKFLRDEPKGFAGNDYYFEITVEEAGGFPWVWVGGGAAAAGVAVALLLKKDIPPTELAEPPGRPPR